MAQAKEVYNLNSTNVNEKVQLEAVEALAEQLSRDDKAKLVKHLMRTSEISISMGGFNANTVDVLVYIQSADKANLASVTEAIAVENYVRSRMTLSSNRLSAKSVCLFI